MRATSFVIGVALLTGCPPPAAPPPPPAPAAPTPAAAKPDSAPTIVGQIDRTELKVRMMKVKQAADAFKALEGHWPKSVAELVKGEQMSAEDGLDPWGHEFTLEPGGPKLAVKTLGQDGKPGGTGLDADVSSADLL